MSDATHEANAENKAIPLLTVIIQVRDEHLHQNAKRITVPRVSIFLWKHFEPFVLSTTSSISRSGAKHVAHVLRAIAYLLLWRNTAGLSHTLNACEELGEEKKGSILSVLSALQPTE